ncbi:MAG: hypothetical protein QNJ42_15955 [Crocosphaera sp.]|nr:hypothetical protein [Crocosphaera sp.]
MYLKDILLENVASIDFLDVTLPFNNERFSECKRSFDYYKKTKAFEEEIEEKIKLGNKPKVLTEGETDPIYIKTALELLGHQGILEQVDIEWVGKNISKGNNINTGDKRNRKLSKDGFL